MAEEPAHSEFLFLDTDIFMLLAGAGLMREFADATGLSLSNVRRLAALPSMLRRGPLVGKYSEGVRQRATAWSSVIEPLTDAPPMQTMAQLISMPDIDPGEAMLFAYAVGMDRAIVATGDRRACIALSEAKGLEPIRQALSGKVICLETALAMLLKAVGYEILSKGFTEVQQYNATLRILLPQGQNTPEQQFTKGLESYRRDLAGELGSLLYLR